MVIAGAATVEFRRRHCAVAPVPGRRGATGGRDRDGVDGDRDATEGVPGLRRSRGGRRYRRGDPRPGGLADHRSPAALDHGDEQPGRSGRCRPWHAGRPRIRRWRRGSRCSAPGRCPGDRRDPLPTASISASPAAQAWQVSRQNPIPISPMRSHNRAMVSKWRAMAWCRRRCSPDRPERRCSAPLWAFSQRSNPALDVLVVGMPAVHDHRRRVDLGGGVTGVPAGSLRLGMRTRLLAEATLIRLGAWT